MTLNPVKPGLQSLGTSIGLKDVPTTTLPSLLRFHVNSLTSYNGIHRRELRAHRLYALDIIAELNLRDAIHLVISSKAYIRFQALEYAYNDDPSF